MVIAPLPDAREMTWTGLESLRPGLERYLRRRCQDENEVDDIIQETLLRAARYRGGLQANARLAPWVTRIAGNVFRDHARFTQRRPSVGHDEELFERLESRDPSPSTLTCTDGFQVGAQYVDRGTLTLYMRECFAGLIDRDRDVLTVYYGEGRDARATAAHCGIAVALVKVRLFRARRRLAHAMHLVLCSRRSRRLVARL
ncbi:MAG: RNA polymerase sigma factor [bacterium]|nr:RNA polymerase sigma factor [bacterium]